MLQDASSEDATIQDSKSEDAPRWVKMMLMEAAHFE